MRNNLAVRSSKAIVPALAAMLLLLAASAALASPSNKWRIQCSGGANSDGVIAFQIQPVGGTALAIEVSVKSGTGENAVARRIRDVLKAKLPKDAFSVEVDDGEDVLVKKRYGAPNFDLVVASNSVKGVRLNPDHE